MSSVISIATDATAADVVVIAKFSVFFGFFSRFCNFFYSFLPNGDTRTTCNNNNNTLLYCGVCVYHVYAAGVCPSVTPGYNGEDDAI